MTDIRMPGVSGLEVLARTREVDPEIPVILMTAQASLQSAVRAVNEGAYYYLQKPFANDDLLAICRRAAEARELRVENRKLKKEISRQGKRSKNRPIGKSKGFLEVLELAETVAPTDSTILLGGESGTGKEVIAKYVHELSSRSEGPFFSINCGALPESLLESELFGHVKGSFTGAVKDKEGLLVAAKGGTFFLDEIGEMSPATQVKLLRALQEREVIPVGCHGAGLGRRTDHRGDQPGPGGGDPTGFLPERSLLPVERHRPPSSTSEGASRGYPPLRQTFSGEGRGQKLRIRGPVPHRRGHAGSHDL